MISIPESRAERYSAIDENIGRLLNYLEKEGFAENSIVIFTTDQGYFMGEHGLFDKRMMYKESMHMPFVIRYPQEIEPGTKNKDIILNIDFAPFLLGHAGIPIPDDPKELNNLYTNTMITTR